MQRLIALVGILLVVGCQRARPAESASQAEAVDEVCSDKDALRTATLRILVDGGMEWAEPIPERLRAWVATVEPLCLRKAFNSWLQYHAKEVRRQELAARIEAIVSESMPKPQTEP